MYDWIDISLLISQSCGYFMWWWCIIL